MRRSPDLLLDRPPPRDINQVIVGDITYLPALGSDFFYLAKWQDMCGRHVTGWWLDDHLGAEIVLRALEQGRARRNWSAGLIVHSDGGAQYSSRRVRRFLATHGYRQSMTRRDNHYDNAMGESFFSRFKAELLTDLEPTADLHEARRRTFEYIEGYYNTTRKHSALAYRSPMQFEQWLDSHRQTDPPGV